MRADHVFDQGIPVPAAWGPGLKFRARVRQALAKAREQCADHVCTFHGIYRGPPAAAAAARPLGPRTGEKWIARQPRRLEVWVAAHHAADEWWCVKALAGVPYRILFVARSRGAALDTRFCRIVTATSARGPAVGSSSGSTPAFSHFFKKGAAGGAEEGRHPFPARGAGAAHPGSRGRAGGRQRRRPTTAPEEPVGGRARESPGPRSLAPRRGTPYGVRPGRAGPIRGVVRDQPAGLGRHQGPDPAEALAVMDADW